MRIYVFVDDVRMIPKAENAFGSPNSHAVPEDCQESVRFDSYEEFLRWLVSDSRFNGTHPCELVLALDHDMGYSNATNMNGKQGVLQLRKLWECKLLPPVVRANVHSWNPDGARDMAELLHGMGIPTTRQWF